MVRVPLADSGQPDTRDSDVLRRRLRPLYVATFLQGLALWVPIEKLFMASIGFDAASIGVMAAVYAVVVPIFEVPSGVLADRWSRRGVLLVGTVAAALSVTIGGLSQNVATYLVSAMFLGVFFAMQSGTLESVVYDTILEETGGSDDFERVVGRVRLVESVALVASALAGGVIAEFAPLRLTYFLTAPLLVAACVVLLTFREPTLHKVEEAQPLRRQVGTTYRTLMQRGRLRLVVALTVAGSLLMQGMLEFGPLWLIALSVPAFWYGPHWAGLTAALGLGGLVGPHRWMTRRWAAVGLALGTIGCCLVLILSGSAVLVVAAQVLLTLLVVAVSIPVMRQLHDAVPSTVRAGVASGVGTLTWLTFVPFALVIGLISDRAGVEDAGWLLLAIGAVAGILMVVVLPRAPAEPVEVPEVVPLPRAPEPIFAVDRFRPADDSEWPGHWAVPPRVWEDLGVSVDGDAAVAEVRAAIVALPPDLRRVVVLRDVEGRSPEEVRAALGLTADVERAILHQARARIRARLEGYFEGRPNE
jgi:MFS family permease